MRIFFGPGYRVYFGKQKNKIIVLLCGGQKGSQKRDIEKAQKYWKKYKEVRKSNKEQKDMGIL